jgi:3'-phosphoadenosine 5'-phosphosulfate (PAPS) 3'-phosphatase
MTEISIPGLPTDRPRDKGELNDLLLAAGRAVDLGRRLMVHGRSHMGALIAKGDRDYATRVDLQIETQIKAALAGAAAEILFLGEETGGSLEPTRMWVLDPIDGTTNFIKGSPLCAFALVRRTPQIGAETAPMGWTERQPSVIPSRKIVRLLGIGVACTGTAEPNSRYDSKGR